MRRQADLLARSACVLFVALSIGACEEDIVLVEDTELAFTMYGVLTPMTDTQYVHVFPIDGKLEQGTGSKLDVEFTSTDLVSGEVRVWADSVVQDENGVYGHVYWSPFQADYAHSYELGVRRQERASTVEVQIPSELRPLTPSEGWSTPTQIGVTLEGGTPRLLNVRVAYIAGAFVGFDRTGEKVFQYRDVVLPYASTAYQEDGNWWVPIDLVAEYDRIKDKLAMHHPLAVLDEHGISLQLITLDLIVANDEWAPPGGCMDPLALAHPHVMTNVHNGYGFVGAGYRIRHQWRPLTEVVDRSGYEAPGLGSYQGGGLDAPPDPLENCSYVAPPS